MKRYAPGLILLFSSLLLSGVVAAQTEGGGDSPPQTTLFMDALFLARAIPFLVALGIVLGIVQARAATRVGGGDTIIGDKVRRHGISTVIAHWTNAVGIIIGLATGALLLGWIEYGDELRPLFVIHYIGAALTIFGLSKHLARHGVSGGTGLIPKRFGVISELIGELFEYLGLFGPKGAVLRIPWPKAIRQPIAKYVKVLLGYKPSHTGKYLATEQMLSYPPWTILITLIVVTGLIKSLRYVIAIPSELIATTTTIHDLTAIGILVMLVIHLLPLFLVPANWPLLVSMFTTRVSRKYVEERHPAWYKELKAKQDREQQLVSEASQPLATAEVQSGD